MGTGLIKYKKSVIGWYRQSDRSTSTTHTPSGTVVTAQCTDGTSVAAPYPSSLGRSNTRGVHKPGCEISVLG